MNIKSDKIYNYKPLVSLMLLLLVKPDYFGQIPLLSKFFTYGSFIVTIFLIFLLCKDGIVTKYLVWIILFFGVELTATLLNGGDNLYSYMRSQFQALGVCLLFYLWLNKNPDVLLNGFSILELYIYINLLTVLLFPNGMYESTLYTANWFLGYKNPQIRTILPILTIALIRSYRKHGKVSFNTKCLLVCSGLTFLLIDSATALVGFIVFVCGLLIFHSMQKSLPRILTLLNGLCVSLLLFFMIVVFKMQVIFSTFIESFLGRSLDFTGRTTIWDETIALFINQPILGYGYLTGDDYVGLLGDAHFTHPHNYFLYIAMCGGVIMLAVLLWGFIMANSNLVKTSDSIYSKIILWCLFAFLIMGLDEAITGTVLLYPILLLAMEADKIYPLPYQNKKDCLHIFGIRIYPHVPVFKVSRS